MSQWTDGAFRFDGDYLAQWETARRIYAERLLPREEPLVNQYIIRASRTRIAPEF